MTPEEKVKALDKLMYIRQEIDQVSGMAFTYFVEAVHNLSQMLQPLVKQQQALAYKLMEIEKELRDEVEEKNGQHDKEVSVS